MATWSNSASMSKVVYFVATSIDGYIADATGSLEWLTSLEEAPEELSSEFMATVGVQVMGSTTYEWLLREENIIAQPEKWSSFFGHMKTVVFSSRELPTPQGAEIVLVNGSVSEHFSQITQLAGDGVIWVVGGGELATQFLDAGLLDIVEITLAPVLLGSGTPLFTELQSRNALQLRESQTHGSFVHLKYDVSSQ
jgi:dihydrofolate reductase